MPLGFGFNKAKVLSSAEKYVQQGKLQNAIQEYEKVIKHDPKDLTVLNTVGDLYARVGQADKAASYFRKVGEAYAADGFTVKAIAIYKKVTKITPGAAESVLRLAELYTQQGLVNDARQQYLQLAEQHVKGGDVDAAVRVFHKMLELDPDNAAMQARLAELYIRKGKKDEAQEIFFRAAQSLRQRGANEAADEALARVLSLSPGNPRALMMRAQVALETGNAAGAVRHLEQIANIDSSAEGLAVLLRARLLLRQGDEAEPIARKLLVVHNDMSGINAFAEWLVANGEFERALRMYGEHSDRLLASNPEPLLKALRTMTERVGQNAAALEMVLALLQKAGDQTQLTEVMELLAHALVQSGDLARARDLYRELAQLEPENPIHDQNYRKTIARLGEDAAVRPLSAQEAGQAFMVDELEVSASAIEQGHPPPLEDAIKAAVTEAELLDSYNLLPKAIATLEAALPRAPRDARLNQRLASLYARTERMAEAANCCDTLASVYRDAGHTERALEYSELAAKYRERAAAAAPVEIETAVPGISAEFTVEAASPPEIVPAAAEFATEAVVEQAPEELPVQPAAATAQEIDLSEEWQSSLTSEPSPVIEVTGRVPAATGPAAAAQPDATLITELLDEIRFYISQQMWEEAAAVADKCERVSPGLPELAALKEQIAAAPAIDDELGAAAEVVAVELEPPAVMVASKLPAVSQPAPVAHPVMVPPPAPAPQPVASGNVLDDFVADLEQSIGLDFGETTEPAATPEMAAVAAAVSMPAIGAPASAAAATAPEAVPGDRPGDMLSEMFEEFKEDAEQGDSDREDLESHYNLGIAFREMGLLDEAIGELQKVAQGVERGRPFRDALQVYTWLGQCFREKNVPEAAVRWYEKALKHSPDEDARIAVHYELGATHEAAGRRQDALKHYLEVYGTNIDYRDVAQRIQALRS